VLVKTERHRAGPIKKELATIKKQLKKDLVANKKVLATIKKQLKKEAKTQATPAPNMG
jgi:hypothetical protein